MNDIMKIREWLRNPSDYNAGLELYLKYKTNSKMDDFFNRHRGMHDVVAVQMLVEKLTSIEAKLRLDPGFLEKKVVENFPQLMAGKMETPKSKSNPQEMAEQLMAQPEPSALGKVDPNNLPEHLSASYKRVQEITLLMGGVHAKLKAETVQSKAHALVSELAALDTEKRRLWELIDQYYKVPSLDVIVQGMDEGALKRKIKTVKDTIRRIEHRIPQQKNKPALQNNSKNSLKEKQEELKILEEQLNDKTRG